MWWAYDFIISGISNLIIYFWTPEDTSSFRISDFAPGSKSRIGLIFTVTSAKLNLVILVSFNTGTHQSLDTTKVKNNYFIIYNIIYDNKLLRDHRGG